jgi:hypothetical protein
MDNIQAYTASLTANQYTARANLVRSTAANTADAGIRRQLLGIVEEYEWLADAIEARASRRVHDL